MIIFSIIIILHIFQIIFPEETNSDFKCGIDAPLYNIESEECVITAYDETIHQISNEIIKIQWMNKFNKIGNKEVWYMGYDISSNGDLVIESFRYNGGQIAKKRFFYGIKSNGRGAFYDSETNTFINQIIINNTRMDVPKFELEFMKINLVDDDENDYYISTTCVNFTAEIIDFKNSQVLGVYQGLLFDIEVFSFRYSIFELSNFPKTYLFSFMGVQDSLYYLCLQKFQFYKTDLFLENSFEKLASTPINTNYQIFKARMNSCIEIAKFSLIECFYLNISQYFYLGLYDENNLEFKYSEKVDETFINELSGGGDFVGGYEGFFKCILLKNEISILAYVVIKDGKYIVIIQIKEVIHDQKINSYYFKDYLDRYKQIEINKVKMMNNGYYLYDLVKINNNKFALTFSSFGTYEKLYIVIFQLYNFHETNLYIKYYSINLSLYGHRIHRFIKSVVYNEYLGVIIVTDNNGIYQYFSLFSYINSTDSDLIYLDEQTDFKLNEYINTEYLENNIFGYILKGIKILKLPESDNLGVYYVSKSNNELIFEIDIISINEIINFDFDYENLIKGNDVYTIEFAGIVQERNFNEDKQFAIYAEQYGNGDFENYYSQKIYIGRTSFYNFTISNTISGNNIKNCSSNCKLCHSGECLKCESTYKLIIDQNKCESEFNEEGYYLDEDNSVYKKCHEFCKSCNNKPKYYDELLEIEDTNCNECIDNYYKLENTNNCISKDSLLLYYYFNTTEQKFKKCSENCLTCNQSQINSTYFGCTSCDEISIFYPQSTNCLNCFTRNQYTSPYFNECLDEIPEGYYLEDQDNKILGVCYHSCKACNIKGNEANHQCTSCNEEYPFNYKNIKCLNNCSEEYLYADLESKKCFDKCLDNENNNKKFGFNFVCYMDCPTGTKLDDSITEEKICICENLYYKKGKEIICINGDICPDEFPIKRENSFECISECNYLYKLDCYYACPENTYEHNVNNKIICLDIINETISLNDLNLDQFSDFNYFDESFNSSENIVINYNLGIDINIYQSTFNIDNISPNNSNLTFIDLGECGKELKEFYHLSQEEILYIIIAETKNSISNRVSNQFIFNIYLKNGTKLEDLSVCYNNSATFSVTSHLSNLDLVNYDEAKIFLSQGYNIYNLTSEFYTDGCSPAKIGSNDIPLKDRKLIFPSNVSFCPENCEFSEVMIEAKRIRCFCGVDFTDEYVNISTNFIKVNATDNFFIYLLDNLNYKIFKCYKIILKLNYNNLVTNIGFIFCFATLIFDLLCLLIFSCYSLTKIRLKVIRLFPEEKKVEGNNNSLIPKSSQISKKNIKRRTINNNTLRNSKSNNSISFAINRNSIKLKTTKYDNNSKTRRQSVLKPYTRKGSDTPLYSINNKNKKKLKDKKIIEIEYNYLPYTEALKKDHRNIFIIFINIFKYKLDFISLLFYPGEFSAKPYTLSMYFLDFLFEFFNNAILYTDDIVSEKYHNNGDLNVLTSIFLSLVSNFISWLAIQIFKDIFLFEEHLLILTKESKTKRSFIISFTKLYFILKLKAFAYYFFSFILIFGMTYYLTIFCYIYKESQISLLINYFMGIIESIIISIGISIIITILRFIGLQSKNKYLYRTSVFLDQKM